LIGWLCINIVVILSLSLGGKSLAVGCFAWDGWRYGLDGERGWIPGYPMDGRATVVEDNYYGVLGERHPRLGCRVSFDQVPTLEIVHTYPLSTLAVLDWLSYYKGKFNSPCLKREGGVILLADVRDVFRLLFLLST
jgi:hypothetical protein